MKKSECDWNTFQRKWWSQFTKKELIEDTIQGDIELQKYLRKYFRLKETYNKLRKK